MGCDESIESNFRDYVFQYKHPHWMRYLVGAAVVGLGVSIHASTWDTINSNFNEL